MHTNPAYFAGTRARDECREWIKDTVGQTAEMFTDEDATTIMDHCFRVALHLLKGKVSEWVENDNGKIVNTGNISV